MDPAGPWARQTAFFALATGALRARVRSSRYVRVDISAALRAAASPSARGSRRLPPRGDVRVASTVGVGVPTLNFEPRNAPGRVRHRPKRAQN